MYSVESSTHDQVRSEMVAIQWNEPVKKRQPVTYRKSEQVMYSIQNFISCSSFTASSLNERTTKTWYRWYRASWCFLHAGKLTGNSWKDTPQRISILVFYVPCITFAPSKSFFLESRDAELTTDFFAKNKLNMWCDFLRFVFINMMKMRNFPQRVKERLILHHLLSMTV